jgi:guanine deaminase
VKIALRGQVLTSRADSSEAFYLEDGLVLLDELGKIAAVEAFSVEATRGAEVRDLRPWLISPGFVDAHLHYPQIRVIGSASGPLMPWLERTVFPEEARFVHPEHARIVANELVQRLVAMGTTTAVLFSSSSPSATDILFETLAFSGLRAIAGLTLMDQHCPEAVRVSADEALAAARRLSAAYHGYDDGRLAFAITPRFAPTCSRRSMCTLGPKITSTFTKKRDFSVRKRCSPMRFICRRRNGIAFGKMRRGLSIVPIPTFSWEVVDIR